MQSNQDFSEMEQEMTSVEDSYDSIAPATQSVELQDEAEGSRDLHPDFNENYNFADDIGIPSIDSNSEPLILNELEDNEYRHLVQMLNKKQKKFFNHVLHLTKRLMNGSTAFLVGVQVLAKHTLPKLYIRQH